MANVKSYSRKSKTGKIHRVGSHYRKNPELSGKIYYSPDGKRHRAGLKEKTVMSEKKKKSDKTIVKRMSENRMDFISDDGIFQKGAIVEKLTYGMDRQGISIKVEDMRENKRPFESRSQRIHLSPKQAKSLKDFLNEVV